MECFLCPIAHTFICEFAHEDCQGKASQNSEIRNLAEWWENEMKATAVNDESCSNKETIWVWHLMMKLDWSARRNEPKIAPKKKCWIALAKKEEVEERVKFWTQNARSASRFNSMLGHPSSKSGFPIWFLQFKSVKYFAFQRVLSNSEKNMQKAELISAVNSDLTWRK